MERRRAAGFRADVEGLRGVAVLAVVGYHAGLGALAGGYVGVDVFFVLSGFLITGLLWAEVEHGGIRFGAFYARRIRRLLPAATLVVAATAVASWWWLSPLQAAEVGRDALASVTEWVNVRFAQLGTDYLAAAAPPSPLQHYWSLSVEEQFYVLWPLLVAAGAALAHRSGGRRWPAVAVLAVVGAASLAVAIDWTDRDRPWAFFLLPARAWEFVVGGLVALAAGAWRRLPPGGAHVLGAVGALGLVLAIVRFDERTAFPGVAALVPVLGTGAVLAAGTARASAVNAALGTRPLTAIGRISYTWYLWHWPALVLVPVAVGRSLTLPEAVAVAAAAAVPAWLTSVVVERPVRDAPRLRRVAPSVAVGVAVTVVAGGLALVVARTEPAVARTAVAGPAPTHPTGAAILPAASAAPTEPTTSVPLDPSTTAGADAPTTALTSAPTTVPATVARRRQVDDAVHAALATAATQTAVPADLQPPLARAHGDRAPPFADGCFRSFTDSALGRCTYGAADGASTVVLFGDSHAAAWFPALSAYAEDHGDRLLSEAKATCPPLAAEVWSPALGRAYRECDAWRDRVLALLAASPPALVVLAANRAYGPAYRLQQYGPAWLDGLGAMVARLRALGSRVVVLGPVPLPNVDVPDCLSAHPRDDRSCPNDTAEAVDRAGIDAERAAVVGAGGAYVDVSGWFCAADVCPLVVGDLLVFRDQNHLTTAYASWLAPAVGAVLDDALAG